MTAPVPVERNLAQPGRMPLLRHVTPWRVIFAVLMAAGAYSTYLRAMYGLGGVTNLSDRFPWGLWIGFDILCGVGLAAGGFTLVAVVHIFNIERYKPILRPTILTAFLGYLLVILALMFDLGRPDRIWHALIMWNPHSVMFEVAWCVMLYTTVLGLEFAPAILEKLGWKGPLGWLRAISIPLVITGVILSTLHQSSLGTLYLIVPEKLHPLWYSPLLPAFFFLSAISVGLAMTIFEAWHSSRAFGRKLESDLLESMSRVLAVVLSFYLVLRFLDLRHRDALGLVFQGSPESLFFLLETLLMLVPVLLLFRGHGNGRPGVLYASALMVIFGFITNRLNVSITGMEAGSGVPYIPRWSEIAVTLAIIAMGFAIFRFVAARFPVFDAEEEREV